MKCKNDFMIRIPYNSFDYYKESIENKENLSLDKFKENLLISSSGLYDIISKKEKINNDELISLTKYLIRSSTRCTPYGLNSSVMIGNFKEDNILNIHKKHHKKSRPDMSWLIEIIKKLEKDVGIKLKVIINDTNRFVGEKVLKKWNSCYVKNARESERKIYINNTKAVKYVFDMCKQYMSIEDIIKNLKSNSIGVKEESIIEFISSLLDNEFLISDLRPNTLITDPLGYVLEKLEGYNVSTELFCKLLELRSMLDNYEKTDIGEGEEIYKNIINFMESINVSDNYLQIDMYNTSKISLNNKEKIIKAAKLTGADDIIQTLPNKYDQQLGNWFSGGIQLSGGQWQKIAIARSLIRCASMYILDEPTAALDPSAEYSFFKNFRNNILDKIGIFVTHRFSNVKIADNIFVLKDGKLIEQGTHKSLMNNKGDYAKLYNIQIGE